MENLSLISKGDSNYTGEYQQLYILTEHWRSDLEFYKNALRFLHHLINKYFVWFAHKEHHAEMTNLVSRLSEITRMCNDLLRKTSENLRHLTALIDEPFKYDFHQFKSEHENLESEVVSFIKIFREIKKESFAVSEQVIEQEIKRLSY
jgi:cysteinyl-tRNA synthetase